MEKFTGEVEQKHKKQLSKGDNWGLKVDGVWYGGLFSGGTAGSSMAEAFNLAETIMEGEHVTIEWDYDKTGKYHNVITMVKAERPEGAPPPRPAELKIEHSMSGDLRNQWIAYESLISSAVELVRSHPYYAAEEEPHKEVWKVVHAWVMAFPSTFKQGVENPSPTQTSGPQ